MPLSPYLVHVGYALMLVALLARDIAWLRGLLVCAQSTLAAYAWSIGAVGMTGWNVLFVAKVLGRDLVEKIGAGAHAGQAPAVTPGSRDAL